MILLLALLSLGSTRVEAPGCVALEGRVARYLASEIPSGSLLLEVDLADCRATQWMVHLRSADGRVVAGPTMLDVSGFSERSRIRALGLWAAEAWVEPRQVVASPSPRTASEPARPTAKPPKGTTTISTSAGVYALDDPVALAEASPYLRVEATERLLSWVSAGAALEGGALFEPFAHRQPWLRFCVQAETRAELRPGGVSLGTGPRACISGSRHLRDGADDWAVGVAVGGVARASIDMSDRLALGFRVDVEAWERDLLVRTRELEPTEEPGFIADLPWLLMVGGGLELRFAH